MASSMVWHAVGNGGESLDLTESASSIRRRTSIAYLEALLLDKENKHCLQQLQIKYKSLALLGNMAMVGNHRGAGCCLDYYEF